MSEENNKQQNIEETVVEEDFVYDDPELSAKDKIKDIKDKLKACNEEKQEYLDGWQRSKADFVNFKKKTEEDKSRYSDYLTESIFSEFIPILDSFDMAFKNQEAWNQAPKEWRQGIEYIYNQILKIFEDNSINIIDPLGQKFDHNLHNSVATERTEAESEDSKIIEVISKGYMRNGKVIRPANVKVAKFE